MKFEYYLISIIGMIVEIMGIISNNIIPIGVGLIIMMLGYAIGYWREQNEQKS